MQPEGQLLGRFPQGTRGPAEYPAGEGNLKIHCDYVRERERERMRQRERFLAVTLEVSVTESYMLHKADLSKSLRRHTLYTLTVS